MDISEDTVNIDECTSLATNNVDIDSTPEEDNSDLIVEKNLITRWYMLKVMSNKENVVSKDIMTFFERDMKEIPSNQYDLIECFVPVEPAYMNIAGGTKKRSYNKKLAPGYVFLCISCCEEHDSEESAIFFVNKLSESSLMIYRNAGIIPVSELEMDKFIVQVNSRADNIAQKECEKQSEELECSIGDVMVIKSGAFSGLEGVISNVNRHKKNVVMSICVFGKDSTVEIDINKIEKIVKDD